MIRRIVVSLALLVTVSCGGSSSNSTPVTPTPTPTVQSIAVTLVAPLVVGGTAQATAVATLTNGTSQSITTGFKSDVPTVATVTDAGSVTAVSLGLANIYVVSGGQQGTKSIRVLPSFSGSWSGSYYVTGCTQTGAFATLNYCNTAFTTNSVWPYNMSLTQTSDAVAGTHYLGTLQFSESSGTIDGGGQVTLGGNYYSGTGSIYCVWTIGSPTPGRLAGTVTHTWRDSTVTGQMVITGTIRDSMKMNNATPHADPRFEQLVRQWLESTRR